MSATLFGDWPDPKNDAAPSANGASANGQDAPKSTPRNARRKPNSIAPAHRHAPPGTSRVAAARVMPRATAQAAQILAHIQACGEHGCTDDEGETALGIIPQSYTPRRRWLAQRGDVVATDRRRPTRRGCPATVWVARELAPVRVEVPAPTPRSVERWPIPAAYRGGAL